MHAGEIEEKVGEIDAGQDQSNRRHDDIAHQRGDNLPKRRSDNDAHGQVEHVAAHDELFKLFEHDSSLV